jgi:AIPR protein
LGENKVNEDIATSLKTELVPDFWWLNNGITILTTKAVINGKNMMMQDIQVVNGLQTTETIYRHFGSGSRKSLDRTLSIKIIVSQDEKLRDQIIRATNNQSAIEQSALHATDKIQRDIEQILERHEFYYERRKNYYRNIGQPPARFVTPLFVAAGFIAIVLKDPATAAELKSRFMRNQSNYDKVFSDKTPIEVWPRIVAILKAADSEMLLAPRHHVRHGERTLRYWRGLIGILFAAKSFGTFDFTLTDIVGIEVGNINGALVSDCWKFIKVLRKGSRSPGKSLVKEVCAEFAKLHSLGGVESVGRRNLTTFHFTKSSSADVSVSAAFIDQVDTALPPQPWPVGTHLKVAEELGVAPKLVSSAIRRLIDSGRRHEQFRGELFDGDGPKGA